MITVKFFGLISIDSNIRKLTARAGTVAEVIKEILQQCPNLSEKQLKAAVIVINSKQITGIKRFTTSLQDGDELVFLTPASGG
jgi:molybdopterin converting factor small subunit